MTTEIVKLEANKDVALIESGLINYNDDKMLAVIQNTVAKGTTSDEFQMFVEMCKSTGLNPFRKEIWCIVTGEDTDYRRVQMMTGINGFYAIANNHKMFDGCECVYGNMVDEEVKVKRNVYDYSAKKKQWKEVSYKFKRPEWIECRVYRKDRTRPQMFRARWEEFAQEIITSNGKTSIWGSKPCLMLEKCAESMALRKAFPQEMNGLYTAEEMPANYSASNAGVDKSAAQIGAIKDTIKKTANLSAQEVSEAREEVEEALEIEQPQKTGEEFDAYPFVYDVARLAAESVSKLVALMDGKVDYYYSKKEGLVYCEKQISKLDKYVIKQPFETPIDLDEEYPDEDTNSEEAVEIGCEG